VVAAALYPGPREPCWRLVADACMRRICCCSHQTAFVPVCCPAPPAPMTRYEHLEALMEACYPTTPLRPSPEELRELFRATSAG
jgi:hypothetical protein